MPTFRACYERKLKGGNRSATDVKFGLLAENVTFSENGRELGVENPDCDRHRRWKPRLQECVNILPKTASAGENATRPRRGQVSLPVPFVSIGRGNPAPPSRISV